MVKLDLYGEEDKKKEQPKKPPEKKDPKYKNHIPNKGVEKKP